MTLMEKLKVATSLKKISTILKEAKMGNIDQKSNAATLVMVISGMLAIIGIDANADVFDLIKTYIPYLKDGLPLNKVIMLLSGAVIGWYTGKKNKAAKAAPKP